VKSEKELLRQQKADEVNQLMKSRSQQLKYENTFQTQLMI
jgi:hypothetical protein